MTPKGPLARAAELIEKHRIDELWERALRDSEMLTQRDRLLSRDRFLAMPLASELVH